MAYREEDFFDEDNLAEIPCEFCNDMFPMLILMEHQTACRPDLVRVFEPTIEEVEAQFLNFNDDPAIVHPKEDEKIEPPINRNWISITEVTENVPTKEKKPLIKISQSELEINDAKNEQNLKKSSIYIAGIFKILYMLGTCIVGVVWFILKIIFETIMLFWNSETAYIEKFENDEEHEAIEKALLQENETFGCPSKGNSVEEEKLSFKPPPNPLLKNKNSKHHTPNDLTESDNEENESLEEFWKRADIKLVQRLRMLQKRSLVDQ